MLTPEQRIQLVLKVNYSFTAQLEFTKNKQRLGASPTLRSPTPPPKGFEQNSLFISMARSMDIALETSDKLGSRLIKNQEEEELARLKEMAIMLKNEYRLYFMDVTCSESPDQANALYKTAQEKANLTYQAAHNDPRRDAIQEANVVFISSFTEELMKLAPASRPQSTTASSPRSNYSAFFEDSDSDVEEINTTFRTINI